MECSMPTTDITVPGYFEAVVELVKIGAIGLAAVIFVSVFILLLQTKSVDKETAQLRRSYLRYGVACSLIFAGIAFAENYFAAPPSAHEVRLSFSPNFDIRMLPQPRIVLQ